MQLLSRRVLATWQSLAFVLPFGAAAPLAAQQYAAGPAVPTISTEAIYVAAYRRIAAEWCTAGAEDAVTAALDGAKSVAMGTLPMSERAPVAQALDSAHAEVVRSGGCRAIARPMQLVIVDGFDGHKWDTPRIEIAPLTPAEIAGDGQSAQSATRAVELGATPLERFAALADYTFDKSGQLVAGRYRVPVSEAGFEARWVQLESLVLAQHPGLRAVRQRAEVGTRAPMVKRAAMVTGGWDAGSVSGWRTSFRNPDTRVMEVEMYVTRDARANTVIVVDYRGYFQQ